MGTAAARLLLLLPAPFGRGGCQDRGGNGGNDGRPVYRAADRATDAADASATTDTEAADATTGGLEAGCAVAGCQCRLAALVQQLQYHAEAVVWKRIEAQLLQSANHR